MLSSAKERKREQCDSNHHLDTFDHTHRHARAHTHTQAHTHTHIHSIASSCLLHCQPRFVSSRRCLPTSVSHAFLLSRLVQSLAPCSPNHKPNNQLPSFLKAPSLSQTHRHTQTLTHTQTHTDTHRHPQTHTHTHMPSILSHANLVTHAQTRTRPLASQ